MEKCSIIIDYQISKQDIYSVIAMMGCLEEPKVIVELGCWMGSSTIALGFFGRLMGIEKFYTIDNFLGTGSKLKDKAKEENPREILNSNLKSMKLDDFVRVLEMDTSSAANSFNDNSVDFIFIDADHRYSGIMKDLIAWYPKIKNDGIFCGHDFEDLDWDERHIEEDYFEGRHHGVIKATQQFFRRVNWLPDRVWWANKNNSLVTPIKSPNMSAINEFEYSEKGDC